MRAVFSGLSTVMLLLGAVFWLGDEWRSAFSVLSVGKVHTCARVLFGYGIQVRFGIALMISVFIRWIAILIFDFRVDKVFPVVECWHGIPYTILCAWLVYLALSRTSFMDGVADGFRS